MPERARYIDILGDHAEPITVQLVSGTLTYGILRASCMVAEGNTARHYDPSCTIATSNTFVVTIVLRAVCVGLPSRSLEQGSVCADVCVVPKKQRWTLSLCVDETKQSQD